jgi:hypothetical protein
MIKNISALANHFRSGELAKPKKNLDKMGADVFYPVGQGEAFPGDGWR